MTAVGFADPAMRREWTDRKQMMVINFYSDQYRETPVNVFVQYDFDFEREYQNTPQQEVLPGIRARFVSINTLIAMKKQAGRNRDLDDIQHLRWIQEEQQDPDKKIDPWESATWDGSRRAQLRHSLQLTLRERIEAIEDMQEVSDALARSRAKGRIAGPTAAAAAAEQQAPTGASRA